MTSGIVTTSTLEPMHNTKHWHAVYTASRCEKKVRERFEAMGIECFLPVQIVLRQWRYRKKRVEIPVITGIIFVCIEPEEHINVLRTQGVVAFLKLRGEPQAAIIPDKQMKQFRFLIEHAEASVELTNEHLAVGDFVTVIKGSLNGLEGELISFHGCNKIVVRLDTMGCAMVDIPSTYVVTQTAK